MIIAINALEPKPKRPNLVLQKEKIQDNISRIIIYNGGDGPCAEFKISYQNDFDYVEQIVQYQESVITNAKIVGDKIVLPPSAHTPVGICENNNCKIHGGFLAPNQVFALSIKHKNTNTEITASCIDEKVSIRL